MKRSKYEFFIDGKFRVRVNNALWGHFSSVDDAADMIIRYCQEHKFLYTIYYP